MGLAALASGFLVQFKNTFARPTFQFVLFFQPLFYAVMTFYIFQRSGQELLPYLLAGSGLMNLWTSVVFSSAGDIDRERFSGNLEFLLVAPTPFYLTMLAKVLANTVLGLATVALTAVYARVVCGVPLRVAHPALVFAALVLVSVSFVAVAMLMAAIFTLSRNSRGLINGLEFPVFLVCGFLFPVEILPPWTRPISYAMLPTWGVRVLRGALEANPPAGALLTAAALVVGLGLIYGALSVWLFQVIERRVRVRGDLATH